jgi:hypothetical protein
VRGTTRRLIRSLPLPDDDHFFWLYTTCGLVRIARPEMDAWATDSKRTIHVTVFDTSDGVRSHAGIVSGYSPRVAKTPDGKLWFVSGDAVSVIDPRHLPLNNLRHRCTLNKSSPTARNLSHLRTCDCLRTPTPGASVLAAEVPPKDRAQVAHDRSLAVVGRQEIVVIIVHLSGRRKASLIPAIDASNQGDCRV